MSEWQTIDSCPENVPVLVCIDDIVQWLVTTKTDRGWEDLTCGEVISPVMYDFYPTHWMKLPDPPIEEKD